MKQYNKLARISINIDIYESINKNIISNPCTDLVLYEPSNSIIKTNDFSYSNTIYLWFIMYLKLVNTKYLVLFLIISMIFI